jgi:hypothetical protein
MDVYAADFTGLVQSFKLRRMEKLEERRKSNRLCMLYKIKNGLIDIDSHQYIQANDSRTRGKDRLYQVFGLCNY